MSGICGWDISVVALRHARTASSYPVHFPWMVVASKLKIIFLRSCHLHVFLIHLIGPSFNRPAFLCTSPNSQLAGTSQSIIWPFKPSTMFEHETLWKKSYSLRKMQGTRVVLWFAFFFERSCFNMIEQFLVTGLLTHMGWGLSIISCSPGKRSINKWIEFSNFQPNKSPNCSNRRGTWPLAASYTNE